MEQNNSKFLQGMQEFGLPVTEDQMDKLEKYYQNLTEWNSFMNLTAITQREEVYEKHFLDSLSFVKILPQISSLSLNSTAGSTPTIQNDLSGAKIIDVGTGAGFPGLPIAIFYPAAQITLMDSLAKRIRFLEDTISKLQLTNVELIHSRAEDLARNPSYREQFHLCCSRAVANFSTLSEYCLPFVKQGGFFIAYKAEKAEQELSNGKKAVSVLGGEILTPCTFALPGTDYLRVLIPVRKVGKTPKKYPRKAGIPSREPIE